MSGGLSDLVRKHGWHWIPRAALRSCLCPKCGKKGLKYADHAHAFGYKDHSRITCRFCRSVYKQRTKT